MRAKGVMSAGMMSIAAGATVLDAAELPVGNHVSVAAVTAAHDGAHDLRVPSDRLHDRCSAAAAAVPGVVAVQSHMHFLPA